MSSLRSLLISALLATAAVATSHEAQQPPQGQAGGFGQVQGNQGNQGNQGWTPWSNTQQSPPQQGHPGLQPVAACPAGCVPVGTAPPPPAQTRAGELLVQVVSVADKNGSLKYFPNRIDAPVGSIVQFQFFPKNHTITESSFAEPCRPLAANLTSPTRPGIRSGFIPVTGTESFTPVYNVLINDTKPIWLFCGQTNHCQRGMAAVINPPKDSPNTIEKYIENAGKIPLVSVPAPPPPAATAPPPAGQPPVGQPPAPASSSTFAFGAPPANPPAATSVNAPPVQGPPSSSVPVAPATFTGAASSLNVRDASSFGAMILGAMVALL